jgi:drug/metabolite transporter (DMT)-like permease
MGLGMMAFETPVMPAPSQALMLVGTVIFGTSGYWAITSASRTGEVAVVAPFRYTRLVFGIAIGVAVFAEVPDMLTLLGAAVIIGSGLYSFARERARTAASLRRNAA